MKRSFFAAVLISVGMCLWTGCAGTAELAENGVPGNVEAEKPLEESADTLSEEQISRVMTEFAGISREHAEDVWKAKEKADVAMNDITAYWELRQRFGENNQALLGAAIRNSTEAKALLEPLCRLYPHNAALNSLADVVIQGLRSLEAQKK